MLGRDNLADNFYKQYKAMGVTARFCGPDEVALTTLEGRALWIDVVYDVDEPPCTYSRGSSEPPLPAGSAWSTHSCDDAINFAARDLGLPAPERAVV